MRQTLIALGMFFSLSAGLRAARPAVPPVVLKETVLKNGLKVILAPDKTAPVVAIAVTYRVGAKDERPGRTGFAHLFEHMMFQGSANIGKGEHFSLVETNGGDFNGTTSEDRTNYFESLPKNQLDLLLFLEADRMRALNITKANFENQREVVKEERRMNYDNRPYGRSYAEIDNLAYDNFAYKHPVIGHMSDLNAAALEDVQEFFRIYYAPNNASLVLAGDFEPEDALRRVRDRFESIPAQPEPPRPDLAEPEHFGERREMLYDKLARVPMILIMYHIPPGDTP
ncbi:MAG: insulinase family protein, partial [Elusimicrobia bacterium]|nr:insulinase family protein [Elusimicrobiota bacterium]